MAVAFVHRKCQITIFCNSKLAMGKLCRREFPCSLIRLESLQSHFLPFSALFAGEMSCCFKDTRRVPTTSTVIIIINGIPFEFKYLGQRASRTNHKSPKRPTAEEKLKKEEKQTRRRDAVFVHRWLRRKREKIFAISYTWVSISLVRSGPLPALRIRMEY